MSAPLFTIEEARRYQQLSECSRYGHDWDVTGTRSSPLFIMCSRCGWRGTIEMEDRPEWPKGVNV